MQGDVTEVLIVGFWSVVMEGCGGDLEFREFGKDPDEVVPWIDPPSATAFDDGIPDGIGLPCF